MNFSALGWLFAAGVLAHNAEEALLLPAWSANAGPWHAQVSATEFNFAAGVLSTLVLLCAAASSRGGKGSLGVYLLAGYALAMILNAFFPHVLASVLLHTYAPGTATALAFNLPLGGWLLYRAISEKYVRLSIFAWSAPATVIALSASIPLLFWAGRFISTHTGG